MKSYSAYYIKDKNLEELTNLAGGERKLKLTFGEVQAFPDSPWLVCSFRDGAAPPDDDVLWGNSSPAEQKSEKYGEIIFIFCDVSPGSFVFEHARDGVLLRKLVWFPMLDDDWTPGWLCAQGEPEPWEADLFFSQSNLERTIDVERTTGEFQGNPGNFTAREAEIRSIWDKRTIIAGTTVPGCDGTVAPAAEKLLGIKR